MKMIPHGMQQQSQMLLDAYWPPKGRHLHGPSALAVTEPSNVSESQNGYLGHLFCWRRP